MIQSCEKYVKSLDNKVTTSGDPSEMKLAIRQWLSKPVPYVGACGCLGPRGSEPVCPCAMAYVEVVNGKYYRIEEIRTSDGITHSAEYIGDVRE